MKKPPDPFLHLSQPPTHSIAQPYLFISATQPQFMMPEISDLIDIHFRADSPELGLDFINVRLFPAYSSSINPIYSWSSFWLVP